MVLAGGYLPDDDARAPWLAPTRALVAEALQRGRPGVRYLPGRTAPGAGRRWHGRGRHGSRRSAARPLTLRPEAANPTRSSAACRAGDGDRAPFGRRHRAAVRCGLAGREERCPYQAFRVGSGPGACSSTRDAPAPLRTWNQHRLAEQGLDAAELHAQAERDAPAATPVWREVVHRFAGLVEATD